MCNFSLYKLKLFMLDVNRNKGKFISTFSIEHSNLKLRMQRQVKLILSLGHFTKYTKNGINKT